MSYNYLFKYIVVGEAGVGKSCILRRFETGQYDEGIPATTGVEFVRKELTIDGHKIIAQVWDTAGSEQLYSLTSNYFKNCCACLIVFDLTNPKSFERVKLWMQRVEDNANALARKVLIGNKADLTLERMIPKEEASAFAAKNKMDYFEVSAKSNQNIVESFLKLTQNVFLDLKSGKIQASQDSEFGVKPGVLPSPIAAQAPAETANPSRGIASLKTTLEKKNCCK